MKKLVKILILFFPCALILALGYSVFEPEIIKAEAAEDEVIVSATVTGEISITNPDNLTLLPSIPGTTGNSGSPASGSVTWTVITSTSAGFNMKIKASTDPAMKLSSNTFSDYTNATPLDYTWNPSGTTIPAGEAWFGFTVKPATAADTVAAFLDNGSTTCGTGSTNGSDTCWAGLDTTDTNMIYRSSATDGNGEAEVVTFRAESNAKYLPSGSYTATVTATATTN